MASQNKIFSDIYDAYVDKIYRFIFLKVGTQEVAEDLTSEAFSRAWAVFSRRQKSIANINAFLYQIARNLVADHYRQQGQAMLVSTENLTLGDPEGEIGEKALVQSDMELVKGALANIKEEYREALVWYYLDELSAPEIAKMTKKSEEAVRVTIHRGLKALREELGDAPAASSG